MRFSRKGEIKKLLLGSAAAALLCGVAATDAQATNGYFAHGYSIKNKAMAGAGVALPLDSITAATNPAGMVYVGNRYDLGLSLFKPTRSYKTGPGAVNPAAGGTVTSDSENFLVPVLGANWMLESGNGSLGLAIFGNGGMNTDYNTSVYQNFGGGSIPTGVDLSQLFVAPTYARKLNERHSLGITPILAYQKFESQGLQAFGITGVSSNGDKLTNNGHDSSYGYGARIGYMGEITPSLTIGAAYQTKIYMDELDDYAGLFADRGDFDIPSNWTVGFAYKATPKVTLAFDVQTINYNEVNAVGNPLQNASLLGGSGALGIPDGDGFGWDDMTVYKLGLQWQQNDSWTWRAGYSHGEQPIPASEVLFNILAPAVVEDHVTCGFTWKPYENQELDFAMMYGFENTLTGLTQSNAGSQYVELTMDQWEFSLGYSWKF